MARRSVSGKCRDWIWSTHVLQLVMEQMTNSIRQVKDGVHSGASNSFKGSHGAELWLDCPEPRDANPCGLFGLRSLANFERQNVREPQPQFRSERPGWDHVGVLSEGRLNKEI